MVSPLIIKPRRILVVGCGGTGSYLLPLLSNFVFSQAISTYGFEVSLIDPDYLENKNLSRQNFLSTFAGVNKALACSQIYQQDLHSKPYGIALNGDFLTKYLKENSAVKGGSGSIWIIVCADNNAARVDSLRFLLENTSSQNLRNWVWITPGNDKTSGQVYTQVCAQGTLLNSDPLVEFPDLTNNSDVRLNDENRYGCDATPTGGEQSLIANNYAALLTMQILYELYVNETYHPSGYFNFPTDSSEQSCIKLEKGIPLSSINLNASADNTVENTENAEEEMEEEAVYIDVNEEDYEDEYEDETWNEEE